MRTCFLFPGQGAQRPGMGRDFYETSQAVRELFELASEAAGLDLKRLLFEGGEEELGGTREAQLAVALLDSAAALSAREHGVVPEGCAGFSVGEWPALAEAGVLDAERMFRLVSERGRLMDEASRRSPGSVMSAIIGLPAKKLEELLAAAGLERAWVVNYNSPTQSVVSGAGLEVAAVEAAAKAAGASRAIRLRAPGAFHSPLMAYARDGFAELLSDVEFRDPAIALFSNVTGAAVASGAEAKRLAAAQIASPVRWLDEELAVAAAGFELCVETGPGGVLAGLWKASGAALPCRACGSLDELANFSL